jgi:para-nitrobenzyl esterase
MKRTLLIIATLVTLGIGASVLFAGDAPAQQSATPVTATETARTIAQGDLVGFVAPSGAHVWRNVPFAADTGGENRWRAPRPAPVWDGVREALAQGPRCPQIANAFTMSDDPFENGDLLGDEACLNFDIYAPADAEGKNLPVMMWIHGGSNVSGTSADYDGSFLAANENVIVMVVQYRLGPLGWFSHPALRESAQTPEDASANFGTLDLIAALEWIKTNAASFGGDAGNVTIFGESAGGHNVATLLAAPRAKGLFHRAIIQSGGFDSLSIDEAEGRTGDQSNPSLEVASRLGGPERFHTASTQQVFDAFELDGSGFMDLPRVIEDGVVLPDTPLRAAFSSTETFHTVPIITGVNRDEMKMFQVLDPRFTRTRFGRLVVARDAKFYAASAEYGSRVWRIRAVDMPATQMAEAGHGQVYAYRFDWDDGGRVFITNLKKLLGAAHGMEIPFVFNKFELLGPMDRFMFQKKTFKARDELSRDMGAYWTSFAREGVPNHPTKPDWPAYVSGDEALIRFDADSDGGIELLRGADSFEAILEDIKTDTRISTQERCQLVSDLSEWLPEAGTDMGCGV